MPFHDTNLRSLFCSRPVGHSRLYTCGVLLLAGLWSLSAAEPAWAQNSGTLFGNNGGGRGGAGGGGGGSNSGFGSALSGALGGSGSGGAPSAGGGSGFGAGGFGSDIGSGATGAAGGNTNGANNGFVGRNNQNQAFVGRGQAGGEDGGAAFFQALLGANGGGQPGGGGSGGSGGANAPAPTVRPQQRIAFDYRKPAGIVVGKSIAGRFVKLQKRYPQLAGLSIQVGDDGVARLTGTVPSEATARFAENLVRIEPGVRQLESKIVYPPAPATTTP